MTAGRFLYLCQAIFVVLPSQPASMSVLPSLVPKRLSMRLRNRMRPQFRIAQLGYQVSKHSPYLGLAITHISDFRLVAASCKDSVRCSSARLLRKELLNTSLMQFNA